MRPISLEMTAFGSYAQPTILPFDKLSHGLYLVTGDTGAGKTTIFDAIVFALFGEASGSDRTADMMHSDFAEKSTDTVVTLRFSQSGKDYSVRRVIHFPKKRGAEGQYGERQLSALLLEPDRGPTEGPEKVTRRIETLLGMNAGQFRKIVMLAQGEFREFLKADSDKKNEILGRLFDNAAYVSYQNLLAGARDALAKRREANRAELRNLMENVFRMPEGRETEPVLFLPENPELADNLSALTAAEETLLEEKNREREAARRQLRELENRRGAALAINEQFDALDAAKARLAALEAQAEEMAARRAVLERAESAYHRAMPGILSFERADAALNSAQTEAEQLKKTLALCSKELEEAESRAGEDEEKRARIAALDAELGRMVEQLARLKEQEQNSRALTELRRVSARTKTELADGQRRCDELENRLAALRLRLEELEGADALALQRQSEADTAHARREELEELSRERESQAAGEVRLQIARESLASAAGAALAAEEEYHALYRRFLAGQAGLMAEELRVELRDQGETTCPVCGSRITEEKATRLAPRPADVPEEAQVEKARRRAEDAERIRGEQDKRAESLAATLTASRQALLERAEKLLGGFDAELLLHGTLLQRQQAVFDQACAEADSALVRAKQLARERARLRQEQPVQEAELLRARQSAEEKTRVLQEQASRAATMEELIQKTAQELRYADRGEALAEKLRLEQDRLVLSRALDQSRIALERARSRRDTAAGSLAEKEKLALRLAEEQASALEAMEAVLVQSGFADPAAVREALAPAGAEETAPWLRRERETLTGYSAAREHGADELHRLSEQLAGRERVDLSALAEELDTCSAAEARAEEEWSRLENLLGNHRTVLRRAEAALDALARSEGAWRRLDRLGSMAVGVTGEGGKLSFDRYVMGTVFREILEMANRRLDLMSGGRYQLVHCSSTDRRNARAGLEIQVLDLGTGQLRGADSLSGGETFFTSLALALGLSDTVQNRSGGRSLDALFIDEGFGTLSDDVLDKALDVLGQLSEGQRLVGIISHVDRLRESIPQKIRVKNSEKGSTLSLELS